MAAARTPRLVFPLATGSSPLACGEFAKRCLSSRQEAQSPPQERKRMNSLELKYGCNPNQKPARIFMADGSELPVTVLSGTPGYINFLDALNSWQLVRELREATGMPAAASFKHVSPAGAAVGTPLSEEDKKTFFVDDEGELTPIACAYIRARGADRMSSFGDWAALSDTCDERTALYLKHEVSDGVIAPGYTPEALEILRSKKHGRYNVVQIDPGYVCPAVEHKDVFGITFEQGHNFSKIDRELLGNVVTKNKDVPEAAKIDMIVSLITLKYTQSNSVCYVKDGQAVGVGAGQQSRIHCTRLAGSKADTWWLRRHPKVLGLRFVDGIHRPDRDNAIDLYISDERDEVLADGAWQRVFAERPEVLTEDEKRAWLAQQTDVALGSDAFFPFGDNIERAHRSGVRYVAEPGGSIRDDNVIEVADRYGMAMCFTGLRLFHH
ncbi:MAG: phosphoribosylaminoimidazolecarboxamide formyltransferase [Tractidigestivibacter sp.]|nr:phosphoribosylaminoimidazolecarboxamide formyltransferase [Tractidigestivibacter sp.]MDY4533899.1 phosphoribosylaminoimidazolecarboxamide formyltransferase [Tractidigestivibacter sp.]